MNSSRPTDDASAEDLRLLGVLVLGIFSILFLQPIAADDDVSRTSHLKMTSHPTESINPAMTFTRHIFCIYSMTSSGLRFKGRQTSKTSFCLARKTRIFCWRELLKERIIQYQCPYLFPLNQWIWSCICRNSSLLCFAMLFLLISKCFLFLCLFTNSKCTDSCMRS